MEEKETPRQQLERMGAAKVRFLMCNGSLLPPLSGAADQWLAELEEEARARMDASMASQMREARSANRAAWTAAIAAIIAAIVAIIGSIISYLAWVHPMH